MAEWPGCLTESYSVSPASWNVSKYEVKNKKEKTGVYESNYYSCRSWTSVDYISSTSRSTSLNQLLHNFQIFKMNSGIIKAC
jgi:hypothetical protein